MITKEEIRNFYLKYGFTNEYMKEKGNEAFLVNLALSTRKINQSKEKVIQLNPYFLIRDSNNFSHFFPMFCQNILFSYPRGNVTFKVESPDIDTQRCFLQLQINSKNYQNKSYFDIIEGEIDEENRRPKGFVSAYEAGEHFVQRVVNNKLGLVGKLFDHILPK